MANQLKISLDGDGINIVRQCGPAIKDVLKCKYECSIDVLGMDSVMGQDFGQSRNQPMAPEKRWSIQLKTIQVSVWKADLTSFHTDAVVNAANEDLKHYGGLAQALSAAGGPDIQSDSDKYIRMNGPLNTGDAVIGNPGSLQYQKIIHAVGPRLPSHPNQSDVQRAEPQLARTVRNILARAEECKFKSVAIPALSSGLFNFPGEKCADIIVDTLRKYIVGLSYHRDYPCEIALVNNDEPTVKEMERACRQIFGSTTAPVSQAVRSKTNTSGAKTSQTPLTVNIGNVRLTLRKSYIQDQLTDVIVNTTGDNLCLSTGEVSKAILQKAGKKMQEEIDRKYKKPKKQLLSHVLETSPHGLGCKQVYHTVCAGNSSKGAGQILYNAIQECLSLADIQRHKSIAFPAIGTGHLGFTKNEVAHIMTKAVEESAKKMSRKMDVDFVIYPPENDTFMAFEAQIRGLQGQSSPGSDTGVSRGFDGQYTSGAPELRISSPSVEANDEAKSWLENLLRSSGTATVNNNFIQYLGVEELRQLNSGAEPATCIEEFFERGCAKIKVQAESSKDVVVHVLKAEAMLCAVQKEFVREVKAHMPMPSPRSPSDVTSVVLRDREHQFKKQELYIQKILPVDNTALMEVFELKKKQLGSMSPPRRMYQRIPAQFCSMLKDIGFQREYAPPDDPKYGEGIYFAGSVSGAVDLWRQQNHQDVYQYYIEAQVLTGNSTAGKRDLIMPPPVGKDPLVRYDSLTGGPDISVIFNGHQALPEYIFICKFY